MDGLRESCQIVYIPDKPPVPPDQQPTVNVFASVIEPKHANDLIRRLNQIAPLENLRHVKRIQKKKLAEGQTELSVILCVAFEDEKWFTGLPLDVNELINVHHLSPFVTKVCKYAATSKEEWEEQCKLWPTSFHPPTYNIDGITGFGEEESKSVFSFMKMAIKLAKSGDGSVVNAAIIVDPSIRQMIACGRDQVFSWHTHENKASTRNMYFRHPERISTYSDSGVVSTCRASPSDSLNETEKLSVDASCLKPWQWNEKLPDISNCCYWHPLQHAVIVAIESSADRDRRLFPSSEDIEQNSSEPTESSCVGSSAKRQKTNLENEDDRELDARNEDTYSVSVRPYLCTGYDIYLAWEPCIMCAMALVHQRIRRIFYALPNPSAGALGSVHRLQGEKSLNHHYAAFRVFIPQVLDMVENRNSC